MPVAEDKRKVVEEVQKDRKYAIDAAVVRIMKSRKTLEHQQLVPQVLQQVRPARRARGSPSGAMKLAAWPSAA